MAKVRVIINYPGQRIDIDAPYDVTRRRQDVLKSLGCTWDPDRRLWLLDDVTGLEFWARQLADALRAIGDTPVTWSRRRRAVR